MINEIVHGDCLELMKSIPDEYVDLVVTDPPYLMNYRSNRRKDKFDFIDNDKNSTNLISDYIEECHRILKQDTAIYMFCSWHHIDFFKQEFEQHFTLKNLLVWEKNVHGTGDLEGSYAPKHELALYGHKGRQKLNGGRIPDIIKSRKVIPDEMVHPTEKPVDICQLFIEKSSPLDGIVFDGFMGSGTTAVAAMSSGRRFIGSEIDLRYVQIARSRLHSVQPVMNF